MYPVQEIKYIKVGLPSGKSVEVRPFTGKEEKLLLMAKTSSDSSGVNNAIKKVLDNCTQGDISTLISPDVEWLFLNLRAMSISPTIEPIFICKSCSHEMKVEIPLSTIKMPVIKESQKMFDVGKDSDGKDIKIVINLPTLETLTTSSEAEKDQEEIYIIFKSLDGVYVGENQVNGVEDTLADFSEWLLSLRGVYLEIIKFIKDIPGVEYTREYKCPECGEDNSVHLKGLTDLFR